MNESGSLISNEQVGYIDGESETVQESNCFEPTTNVPGSDS